jgi:ethanolamine ammonia-lyase small subunit
MTDASATPDPWEFLRQHTPARLAPGRAGHSLPTRALLQFNLDHARARDAVHAVLNAPALCEHLAALVPEPLSLQTQAASRAEYLLRPDRGRRLHSGARQYLETHPPAEPSDLVVVLADGLSALAVERHALPLLERLLPPLRERGWRLAPLVVVEQGRVAVADEIGYLLRAETSLILLGERPGLTSPDSLGAYLTFGPRPGLTDERRNCVSNIRIEGLSYEAAAAKLVYLLTEMKHRRLSGVGLKDDLPPGYLGN